MKEGDFNMKITMDFNEFKKGLEKVNKVSTKKSPLLIIENIYIEANNQGITMTKYNLETQVTVIISGKIEEEGQKLIPASTIKLISNIKNANTMIIKNEEIHIDKKIIKYKNIPVDDYPITKLESNVLKFEISERELSRMLSCSYATAQDETRPILTGINIKGNKVVATNGYYLSIRQSNEFNSDLNITMSNDLWKTLSKLVDKKSDSMIKVYVTEKESKEKIEYTKIRFEFINCSIEGRLFEQEFIKFESIVPDIDKAQTIVYITDKNLQEKLKLFNTLESKKVIVKLNITDDNFTITSSDAENSLTDEIEYTNKKGDNLLIAFNNKFLTEVTKQYKENFKIYFSNNNSPLVATNDKENLELLIPSRLTL